MISVKLCLGYVDVARQNHESGRVVKFQLVKLRTAKWKMLERKSMYAIEIRNNSSDVSNLD